MVTELKTATRVDKDRRQHKRYRVHDDALVFIGKETGTIIDMGEGGVAVRFVSVKQDFPAPQRLDLFIAQTKSYLPNLPVKLVKEICTLPLSPFSSLLTKRLCFQFGPLNTEQQIQIREFLRHHAVTAH
jgi:hypothetical protein